MKKQSTLSLQRRKAALGKFVLDMLSIRDKNPKMVWTSSLFEYSVDKEARRLRLLSKQKREVKR